jgi:DNA-binding CsgD family transcriptional regulator
MVLEGVRALGRPLEPTGRQMSSLRAYVTHGSLTEASEALGVSERTLKNHLAALRARLGVHTNAQAVYVLWLGYRDHVESCPQLTHVDCLSPISDLAHFR